MPADQPRDGFLDGDGLRLHYLEWGERSASPTIVLLHHVSSHAHTWDNFARSISRDYHVLALDLRGHGDSQWARQGLYGTEHFASDVAALVDQLGLDQTILLGGSLGGRVALVYAAQHPQKVAALIMEDVGAVRPPNISQTFAARLAAGDPEFDSVEQWATQLRGRNERASDEVFLHLARHGTKRLPNRLLGLKRDQATLRDLVSLELWDYVAQVRAPFMLMIGSESEIVGEDQQQRFLELVPLIRIEHIAEAGHLIVHDQPAVFERTIREFLAAHELR